MNSFLRTVAREENQNALSITPKKSHANKIKNHLEEAKKCHETCVKAIHDSLDKETHFYTQVDIDMSSGAEKDVKYLTKAGARFICSMFGFVPEYQYEQLPQPNGDTYFQVIVTIKDETDGRIIGTGCSVHSSFSWKNPNMAMKMAAKSAMVEATIMAAEIEDMFAMEREAGSIASMMDKSASDSEITEVLKSAQEKGYSINQILGRFNISDINEMTTENVNDLKMLVAKEKKPVASIAEARKTGQKAQ